MAVRCMLVHVRVGMYVKMQVMRRIHACIWTLLYVFDPLSLLPGTAQCVRSRRERAGDDEGGCAWALAWNSKPKIGTVLKKGRYLTAPFEQLPHGFANLLIFLKR